MPNMSLTNRENLIVLITNAITLYSKKMEEVNTTQNQSIVDFVLKSIPDDLKSERIMTAIATLGSHCALQVLKGAKDEGFKTILVSEKKREKLYRRFKFIDEIILVDSFLEIADQKCASVLKENDAIIIPHGTLISQMELSRIESITTPIFGNKWILRWKSDRKMK